MPAAALFRRHRLVIIASVLALVGGAAAAWLLTNRHGAATDGFMAERYGRYVAERQAWVKDDEALDAPTQLHTTCASRDIAINGEPHRLLAVCGRTPNEGGATEPGNIDLYVLKREGSRWRIAAERTGIESGQLGQPGEVSVIQLGPQFYGFELGDTWVGQGYVLGSTKVYVPAAGALRPALDFTSSVSNAGTRECAEDEASGCSDLSRRMSTVPGPQPGAYSIRITSVGTYRGHPVEGTHVLTYDTKRQQYRLPSGFEAHIE